MHFQVFHFVLTLHRFDVIITQGIQIVEILLVNVFCDIHAVKDRTFKLLNIRVLSANSFNQIVQILEDKPSAPMIWRISSTSRP
ncbi:Uncharacterised protein [Citrobacter koseri]|nr:Uncharacterised protein [Citrobacter koseri]